MDEGVEEEAKKPDEVVMGSDWSSFSPVTGARKRPDTERPATLRKRTLQARGCEGAPGCSIYSSRETRGLENGR